MFYAYYIMSVHSRHIAAAAAYQQQQAANLQAANLLLKPKSNFKATAKKSKSTTPS